ncbi:tetratricopeptide repeat protein [Streptomyces lydicamycinicus]|uniref:tetratricopeptide repeat protein n=1 Tax=Streptomyces lydicamycinicus TaxID=1546107 RepID=UPI003D80329C
MGVLPNAALAIAVQHCRRAGSNAQLAEALRRLGNRLSAVGRYEEALAATEEAVELCRELVASDPDAHTSDLAGALLNHSANLGDVGKRREAFAVAEEAVEPLPGVGEVRPSHATPRSGTPKPLGEPK